MDCAKAKDLAARTVSGNATSSDADHAAACPACAQEIARARKVWALMGRIPAALPTRTVDPRSLIRRRPAGLWIAAAAAAVALGVAGLLLFRPAPAAPIAEQTAPAVEPTPEQVRVERELDTVVAEKPDAPAPEPEVVKPPPAPPEEKDPVVVRPEPVPAPAPEKKTPEAPKETAKVEPAPAPPVPPKPAPPSRETLPTAATVQGVEGQVVATINGEELPVKAAFRLTDADAIATRGKNSQAVLAYEDGTRVVLGGDSALGRVLSRGEGKRIEIAQGVVAAQVARRAGDDPLTFSTPHADARVLGTRLVLLVSAASTRLDVKEGRVRLTRKDDGASVDVAADHYAVAAKGTPINARAIPGPKVALREDFERGRWSAAWTPQADPGVKVGVQGGALVFSTPSAGPVDVAPGGLTNDPALKKSLEQVRRVEQLASKKDWARAAALETRGTFQFGNETPLRARVNAWSSHDDPDRLVWLGLNRGIPGQGISLERKGDVLRLWVDGAATALWQKTLPSAKEWETLELWITKDKIAVRRNGLTVAVEASPLKGKAAQLSIGSCAKAELAADEETRLDDLDVAWMTKADFDQISR
jgi:ferric-dicitrate binding protein FerR (iron transport regulator)